jgi:hypothetical protein
MAGGAGRRRGSSGRWVLGRWQVRRGLGEFAVEGSDALDVLRVGEHIERLDVGDGETAVGEETEVAGEGAGVAGDVDDTSGCRGDHGFDGDLLEADAGRVDNDDVRDGEVGEDRLDSAFEAFDVLEFGEVDGGIAIGGGGELDGGDVGDLGGELGSEGADAGVGIDHALRLSLEHAFDDEVDEAFGLACVDLEEGRRGDAVVVALQLLVVGALAAGGA